MARVAFLGLGAMGSRMAANLIAAGHDLSVWNRDPAKAAALVAEGAVLAATPAEAVRDAEFALSMVRDDQVSRQVWTDPGGGALAAMRAGAMAIDCSTLSLEWTRALAQACAARGRSFVEAPLAGSRPQAEARALIFFVGGKPEAVEAVRPLLGNMGAAVHHAGGVGAGAAMKLAVNTLLTVQAALLGELIAGFARTGIDPAHGVGMLAATPVCAPAAKALAEMMLKGAYAPLFPITLAEKDLGYAQAAFGGAEGALAPITTAARTVFQAAVAAGYGADHISGVARLHGG